MKLSKNIMPILKTEILGTNIEINYEKNEYDKLNPLPHDIDKEQFKCKIAAELVNNKNKFNKGVLQDIAKNVDIREVLIACPSMELTDEHTEK